MHCPQCGTALPSASAIALDLCPACLFAAALAADRGSCPYRVVAPIAESARSTTYLAQSPGASGAFVALKILSPRDEAGEVLVRYEHWKPALTRVRHASVARLLDVGLTEEGLIYVASEFVTGWPLSAIDGHPAVAQDGRTEIARQLAAGVAAIHAAGVAHLDLDASTVRVSTSGGLHATILGLGIPMLVDGLEPSPDTDRAALARLERQLDAVMQQ